MSRENHPSHDGIVPDLHEQGGEIVVLHGGAAVEMQQKPVKDAENVGRVPCPEVEEGLAGEGMRGDADHGMSFLPDLRISVP